MDPLMTVARSTWPGQTLINIPDGHDGHWRIISQQRHAATGPGAALADNEIRLDLHDNGTGEDLTLVVPTYTPLQIERWEDQRR